MKAAAVGGKKEVKPRGEVKTQKNQLVGRAKRFKYFVWFVVHTNLFLKRG